MHILNCFSNSRRFSDLYCVLLGLETHQTHDLVHSGSFSALELLLLALFDLFAFDRRICVFVIDLNNLIFYRLLELVEHDRRLHIKRLFFGHLQLRIVAPNVKDVQITVAGTIHPTEAVVDWIVENTVSGAVPVTFVDSLTTRPVENVDTLA